MAAANKKIIVMIRKFYDRIITETGWIDEANPEPRKRTWFELIRGICRYLFGFCPNCNSTAPKMYDCDICDFKKNYNNRPKKEDREYWWNRFIQPR